MESITNFLTNGTIRRWAIGLFASAIIVANGKFQLGLTEFAIGSIAAIAIALITGSNYKEAQIALAEGQKTVSGNNNIVVQPPPVDDKEAAKRLSEI